MEADSMELKVISCKDLKAFNFFQKLNIYVVVSIVNEGDDSSPSPTKNEKKNHQQQQKQKTPIDREGDGNPEWNHVMQFDLKEILSSASSHLLQFDLLSEGTILGDKTIGRVRVPFQDLINDFNGGAFRFVSYQVRTTDGTPNGILDFSFKPIFNIHNNSSHTNHSFGFVQDNNKFGNEFLPVGYTNSNSNSNSDLNFNFNSSGGDEPTPSTNCYPPPPPLPLAIDGYMNPSTHNPSTESYYPTIDQFDNPSSEIHYPTHQIHSSPSEFHNPSPAATATASAAATGEVYYPSPQQQPQPQFDYQLTPSPYHPHHLHHHSLPHMAYYPPPPPPSLLYPPPPPSLLYPPPPPPPTDHHPYGFEFGRGNPNPAAAYGYPNHWASSTPIHW